MVLGAACNEPGTQATRCQRSARLHQNRERTGVPKRAACLGWWMRPDAGIQPAIDNLAGRICATRLSANIRSLPLPVL
jgi:hypothetical protein